MSFNEQLQRYNGSITQTPVPWELKSEEVIPMCLDSFLKWLSREKIYTGE